MSQKCDGTEQDPRLQAPEVEKARAETNPKYVVLVNCITLGSIQKHIYLQWSQSCAASSCCTILQDIPSLLWERRLPSIDLSSSVDFTTLIMLTHKSANVMCCAEVRGGVAMGFSSTKCTNVMVASRSIT